MKDQSIVVAFSKRHAKTTKIASFSVSKSGSGVVMDIGEGELASFKLSSGPKHISPVLARAQFKMMFARMEGPKMTVSCKVVRDQAGTLTVQGKVNRAPFTMKYSALGRSLGRVAPPRLAADDKRILVAMARALDDRANSHFDQAHCALAGVGIIVGALTLNPFELGISFVGYLLSC